MAGRSSLPAMGLDAIAVGIDDEGGVVAGAIILAHARLAVVLAAGLECSGMEGVDRGAALGLEAEMQAGLQVGLHRALDRQDPQARRLLAIAQRTLAVAQPGDVERLQNGIVERAGALEVADAD